MSEIRTRPDERFHEGADPEADRIVTFPNARRKRHRRFGGALVGAGGLLLLAGGLAAGIWHHYQAELEVAATAQRARTLVPEVRVASVRAGDSTIAVTLPATTTAFE